MKLRKLLMGTRASPLALAQSRAFAEALQAQHPGLKVELKKITTSGDRIQNRFLAEVGGKGLFVKEIEEQLLEKKIDFAVHSLKDMPAQLPEALALGCLPERLDFEDVLVTRDGRGLAELGENARLGTSSLRRRLQLQTLRPDLRFAMLRGNIDSRLKRLEQGEFDGIVLAKAGMRRLGLELSRAKILPIVPAPGQGTLAVEIREQDSELREWLRPLHHEDTERISVAERRVMRELGGSCNLPLGVLGAIHQQELKLLAFLATPDGSRSLTAEAEGVADEPLRVAEALVEKIWDQGGRQIVDALFCLQPKA
ncbi:MAG TPA: hydroxymethylbilane synthase [Deltaproteobacteria bacterium]|nr:hydroxymethylbilane synthase [Deltaproteobacteria bacterium]